jgi:hypothetical protein
MAEEHPNMDVVDAILELKGRDPFVPFRIVLTSGDKYLIESGENLVEMRTEFFYATPGGERFAFIRKHQIAAVEGSEQKRPSRRKTRKSA